MIIIDESDMFTQQSLDTQKETMVEFTRKLRLIRRAEIRTRIFPFNMIAEVIDDNEDICKSKKVVKN